MTHVSPVLCGVLAMAIVATAAQVAPGGTARVSGVVVGADAAAAPIRRATVTLRGETGVTRAEITDDAGRFEFAQVPFGKYSLTASRPGFVTATYGARRPGRPGTSLTLAPEHPTSEIRLQMARGAAISGAVRDPNGRPAPNVQILVRPAGAENQPTIGIRGIEQIVTDDRGSYRAYGLAPGTYIVAALPQLSYSATDMRAMTPQEIDAALRALQTRQRAPGDPLPADTGTGPRKMYVPVFHPGTAVQDDAAAITVNAGDDIAGIDIALRIVPAVALEGQVVRPDGASAAGTQVIISGTGGRMPIAYTFAPTLTIRPDAQGRFKYTTVAPGLYTLTARTQDGLFAVAQVVVGDTNHTGVTLALQPGFIFAGAVRFDAVALKPPSNLASTRLTLATPGSSGGGVAVANNTYIGVRPNAGVNLNADGTFEIRNVLPGSYSLLAPAFDGWWLRSAMVAGRDLLDEPISLDRSLSGALLIYTDVRTEVSGVLQTTAGAPAVEHFVLVFSANRQHWFAGSRRTRTARPASDGRYVFMDLPPGDYFLTALDDVEPQQLSDPAFLAQAQAAAVRVSLSEGGKAQLDLKIAR